MHTARTKKNLSYPTLYLKSNLHYQGLQGSSVSEESWVADARYRERPKESLAGSYSQSFRTTRGNHVQSPLIKFAESWASIWKKNPNWLHLDAVLCQLIIICPFQRPVDASFSCTSKINPSHVFLLFHTFERSEICIAISCLQDKQKMYNLPGINQSIPTL